MLTRHLMLCAMTTLVCLLCGCNLIKLAKIDHESIQESAVILTGNPQVYARESLVNLRRDDMAWVNGLLEETTEKEFRNRFGADLERQVSLISTIQVALQGGLDRGQADSRARGEEIADLEHDIRVEKLKKELEEIIKNDDSGSGNGNSSVDGGNGNEGGEGEFDDSLQDIIERIGDVVGNLESNTGHDDKWQPTGNPRDQFRDLAAYREELNAMLNQLQLDDLHDTNGRALFKLRMPVTVVPGAITNRYGALQLNLVKLELNANGDKFYYDLYLRWLGHLTYRLNQSQDARDGSRLVDRELQFLGMTSKLFMPVTFYISTDGPAGTMLDPCLGAASRLQADALDANCQPFTVALPFELGRELTRVFPNLENIIIDLLWNDIDKNAGEPCDNCNNATPACRSHDECEVFKAVDHFSLPECIKSLLSGEALANPLVNEAVLTGSIQWLESSNSEPNNGSCEPKKYKDLIRALEKALTGGENDDDQRTNNDNGRTGDLADRLKGFSSNAQWASWRDRRSGFEIESQYDRRAESPRDAALPQFNEALQVARYRLNAQQRGQLISRERLFQTLEQVDKSLPYLVPIANGLAQRQGLADETRARAEFLVTSLLEINQGIRRHDIYSSNDLKCVSNCSTETSCSRFRDQLEKHSKNNGVNIYSVAPTELAQRVSLSASAAQAIDLAASLSVANPVAGQTLGMEAGYGRRMVDQARALERLPLVVGFTNGAAGNGGDSNVSEGPAFGWIFGPRQRIREGQLRSTVEFDFPPSSFEVSADLAVPAWWPEIKLETCSAWLGKGQSQGNVICNKNTPGVTANTETITVPLPHSRRSLDALTQVLSQGYGAAPETTRIVAAEPRQLNLCRTQGMVHLTLHGTNLWRGPQVSIEGLQASTNAIHILPDMEGIVAGFPADQLAAILNEQSVTRVVVSTQNGSHSFPLGVTHRREAGSCKAVTPGQALQIAPRVVHACTEDDEFALRIMLPKAENPTNISVWLAGRAAHNEPSPCESNTNNSNGDSADCFEFKWQKWPESLHRLSSIPVTIRVGNRILEKTIQRIGKPADCNQAQVEEPGDGEPVSADPDKQPAVTDIQVVDNDGKLMACRQRATLALTGSNLGKVSSVTLLGITGQRRSLSNSGDLAIYRFNDLPRYSNDEAPGSEKITVTVHAGDKVVSQEQIDWVKC